MTRRRILVAAAAAAAWVLAVGGADAAEEIPATPPGARLVGGVAGTKLTALPTTPIVGTLTNTVYPCQQDSPFRGMADGQVVDVSGFTRSYVEVVPDAPLDVSMSFFDNACRPLPEHIDLAGGYDDSFDYAPTGAVERGYVPHEAAYAVVAADAGSGAFALAIYDLSLPPR